MQKYLADDLDAIYVEGERDDTYVYGAYFVSPGEAPKADAIFRSLHFERITLTDEYKGTPSQAYRALSREIDKSQKEIEALNQQIADFLTKQGPQLVAAQN